MPIIEALIFGLIASCAVAAAAVIFVAILTAGVIVGWFQERRHKLQKKRNKAVSAKADKSIRKALRDNNVTHITGIFDADRDELIEIQPWSAQDVDQQVENAHRGGKVVVWS